MKSEYKKILSIILIVVSLVTLFCGCIKIKTPYESQVRSTVRRLGTPEQFAVSAEDVYSLLWMLDIEMDTDRLTKYYTIVYDGVEDFTLTPWQFTRMALLVSGDLRRNDSVRDLMDDDYVLAQVILIGYIVLFFGAAFLGLVALADRIRGKNNGAGTAYFVFRILITAAFLACIIGFNRYAREEDITEYVTFALAFPVIVGLAAAVPFVVHTEEGAISGSLSAAAASVGSRMKDIAGAANTKITGAWICPNCKTVNTKESLFCNHCGTKKPENRCPYCGEVLEKQYEYCIKCGSKLREDSAEPPAAAGMVISLEEAQEIAAPAAEPLIAEPQTAEARNFAAPVSEAPEAPQPVSELAEAPQPEKKKNKVLIIVLIVLLVLALAAAAIFLPKFLKRGNSENPSGGQISSETNDTPSGGNTSGNTPSGGNTSGNVPSGGNTSGNVPEDNPIAVIEIITTEGINMRSGPGTSYKIVGLARYGKTYEVNLDERVNTGGFTWYKLGEEKWIADDGEWIRFVD